MNQQQQGIIWLGLAIVLVLLFTDQTFRDKLFNRGAQKTTTTEKIPYTLTDVFTGVPQSSPKTGTPPTMV